MVKSCKLRLNATYSKAGLTPLLMQTAFLEAEAIVNSRPISSINESIDIEQCVTPSLLCKGRNLQPLPHPASSKQIRDFNELKPLTRWLVHRRILHERFVATWRNAYLLGLQGAKYEQYKHMPPLRVGQIVLLREKGFKGSTWKLARIDEIYTSSDNVPRRLLLQTNTGRFIRHSHDIAVLEEDFMRESPTADLPPAISPAAAAAEPPPPAKTTNEKRQAVRRAPPRAAKENHPHASSN